MGGGIKVISIVVRKPIVAGLSEMEFVLADCQHKFWRYFQSSSTKKQLFRSFDGFAELYKQEPMIRSNISTKP